MKCKTLPTNQELEQQFKNINNLSLESQLVKIRTEIFSGYTYENFKIINNMDAVTKFLQTKFTKEYLLTTDLKFLDCIKVIFCAE